MKTLLMTLVIVVLAGAAMAQDSMGISASPDTHMNFVNITSGVPFEFYLVLLDPSSGLIGGYECGVGFLGGNAPIVLGVTGPNGWTNFGSNLNHLVGFTSPLPATDVTVLATFSCLVVDPAPYETLVTMGASDPSSFGGEGPGYSDGDNPDLLILCDVPADGIVGTISTEVVATEALSLTSVKALFN